MRAKATILLSLLSACAAAKPGAVSSQANGDARAELMAVERAFSQTSLAKGAAEAFNDFMADEAVELTGGAKPVHGRAAIVQGLIPKPGGASFVLSWEPEDAAVSSAGDLGYTWGHYTLELTKPGKSPTNEHGKYLTVWRRDPVSHLWKAIADIGNAD